MRIVSLEVEYPESGWKLEKMTFDSMNLLVGVSGVGKTRILRALMDLKDIKMSVHSGPIGFSNGPEPLRWVVETQSTKETPYKWSGSWDGQRIVEETLEFEGNLLFERRKARWSLEILRALFLQSMPQWKIQRSLWLA